jgi:hypothetical protein
MDGRKRHAAQALAREVVEGCPLDWPVPRRGAAAFNLHFAHARF